MAQRVYEALVEVFPEVDWRLLKAAAFHHRNDVDAAAEAVLSEVIPYLASKTGVSSSPNGTEPSPSDADEDDEETHLLRHQQLGLQNAMSSSSRLESINNENSSETGLRSNSHHLDPVCVDEKILSQPTGLSYETNDVHQFQGIPNFDTNQNIEGKELILLGEPQHQGGSCATSQVMPANMVQENGGSGSGCGTDHYSEWNDFDGPMTGDSDVIIFGKGPQVELVTALELDNSEAEQTPSEVGAHSEFSSIPNNDFENMRSKEVNKIDLLEEMVHDGKSNKQILRSAIDSVLEKMMLVEFQEKAAEQAKVEAAGGGLDILIKVEELKQMLAHAKEANNMHAGEVYGEKAILATEVRELQVRLLCLSNERDKALAIIDEMNQTLEARLAAAEELSKAAEQEKVEKEESARNAFSEQEAIMEVVVQESKILEQQAVENSKLQEFLMDCGLVVDKLQGEISVACQEVRSLKEKFDKGILLSKSMCSSQTSCILSSSGSSHKSMAELKSPRETSLSSSIKSQSPASSHKSFELVAEGDETSRSPRVRSPTTSVGGVTPETHLLKERNLNNHKEALENGWDFL